MDDIIDVIIGGLGYSLIWVAVDYKRPKEYTFNLTQKLMWVQIGLITIGVLLARYNLK